jgi:hypothetical protein
MHVLFVIDGVDRDDVGMIEGGERAHLAAKALEPVRVGGDLGRQHLEGDVASKRGIGGEIHRSHAAAADQSLDDEATQRRSWCQLLIRLSGPTRDTRTSGGPVLRSEFVAGIRHSTEWQRQLNRHSPLISLKSQGTLICG